MQRIGRGLLVAFAAAWVACGGGDTDGTDEGAAVDVATDLGSDEGQVPGDDGTRTDEGVAVADEGPGADTNGAPDVPATTDDGPADPGTTDPGTTPDEGPAPDLGADDVGAGDVGAVDPGPADEGPAATDDGPAPTDSGPADVPPPVPPLLTSAHSGWQEPQCQDCHDQAGHRAGLEGWQCVACHGTNGAPRDHDRTGCSCHGNKHGYTPVNECLACHRPQ